MAHSKQTQDKTSAAEENCQNWRELLEWSVDCLAKAKVEQPRADGEILLAEVVGQERRKVYLDPDRMISRKMFSDCQNLVKRRVSREPIHYILGRREFWSLDFKVSPHVFIPRPETEILIEQLLKFIRDDPENRAPRILDIGAGSGNISVAAAREIPGSRITAVDISPEALKVALENAATHEVSGQIHFLQSDLFEEIREEDLGSFDFILTNPPYIDSRQIANLTPEIKDYEPRKALDGGAGGFEYYRKIIPRAGEWLAGTGYLILEIDHQQDTMVAGLIEETGDFEKPAITLDYSGYPRVVSARKKRHG